MSGFEVIGAVAAAGQFIEQGFKIVALVRSISSSLHDGPADIQRRFDRLQTLMSLSKRIKETECLQTAEAAQILKRSEEAAIDLRARLEALDFQSQDSLGKKTWRAVCSLMEEEDILKAFDTLDQEQNLLSLHIAALNSEAGQKMNETMQTGLSSIESQLKSIAETSDTSPESTKCLKALFVTNPSEDRAALKTAKGDVLTGTCDWIISNEKFLEWESSKNGLIWISGGPGMGKTMASIFLTEHLERELEVTPEIVTYFFCDFKDDRRNSAISILRGLIFQLLQSDERLISHILPTYQIRGEQLFQERSFETLWNILLQMIGTARVSCILDGLDELHLSSLEALLSKLGAASGIEAQFRVIVVSREHPKCLRSSLGQFLRIRLDPDAKDEISAGLEQYISTRVAELARSENYSDALSDHIKKTLAERSDGTYLWVSFVVKDLRSVEAADVEKRLNELPQGLDAYYARMLDQIEKSQRIMVCDILRWCTFAARPLAPHELIDALGIEATKPMTKDEILRSKLACCGHFVNMSRSAVTLIHQSAFDFLTHQPPEGRVKPWYSLHDCEREHSTLSSTCVSHLCNGCLEREDLPSHWRIEDSKPEELSFGFFPYASLYWHHHFRLSGLHGASILDDHAGFFSETSPVREKWQIWRYAPGGLAHLAAEFGLDILMDRLLSNEARASWRRLSGHSLISTLDKFQRTPLHLAANKGFLAIVQMLVKKKARVDGKDCYDRTPLWYAAQAGSKEIAECLLQSGANPNGSRSIFNNKPRPLNAAARFGNFEVVKLLLEWNADVDLRDEDGVSSCMEAAESSSIRGFELLLNHSTNLEMRDRMGWALIHHACIAGSWKALEVLLERQPDMDVNQTTKDGSAPLHLSVWSKDAQTAQLLLRQPSIEINPRDHKGRTPLYRAIDEGRTSIAKVLVQEWQFPLPEPCQALPLGPTHLAASCYPADDAVEMLEFLVGDLKLDPQLRTWPPRNRNDRWHNNHFSDEGPDSCSETPLSVALRKGNVKAAEYLLTRANIDLEASCRGCDGARPLHVAAEQDQSEAVLYLLERWKVDVNARDSRQRTALHLIGSGYFGRRETLRYLLEAGAQVALRDSEGCTARDILVSTARDRHLKKFDEIVERYGRRERAGDGEGV